MSLTQGDIKAVINSVYKEGRNPNDLEGLLINSDDFRELLKMISEDYYHNGRGMKYGEPRIFGVKLIESPYIQKGTVFKIFKDSNQIHLSPPGVMWDVPIDQWSEPAQTINGSGVIPGMEHLVKTPPIVDDVKIAEEEKQHERKHSNTRKIELD